MPFVIAFIVAVAGFMGWLALKPSCAGVEVAGQAQCQEAFSAAFCAHAMAQGLAAAQKGGGAYTTQAKCLDQYPVCIERSDVAGWTPKPRAYCVAAGPDGAVARAEPVYGIR
ncbi:MAG: hypothetical protein ACK5JM_13835 [Rhodoblastus sp.]